MIKSYHKSKATEESDKPSMMGSDFELKNVEISKTSLVETINQDNKNPSITNLLYYFLKALWYTSNIFYIFSFLVFFFLFFYNIYLKFLNKFKDLYLFIVILNITSFFLTLNLFRERILQLDTIDKWWSSNSCGYR